MPKGKPGMLVKEKRRRPLLPQSRHFVTYPQARQLYSAVAASHGPVIYLLLLKTQVFHLTGGYRKQPVIQQLSSVDRYATPKRPTKAETAVCVAFPSMSVDWGGDH